MTAVRRYLGRAGVVFGVVPALVLGTSPVRAGTRTIETVNGICHYTAGTVEGVAVSVPPARQTGIVCTVFENGIQIGGCGGAADAPAAACTGPVVGFGPPVVCTKAWAVYARGTIVYDEHCE